MDFTALSKTESNSTRKASLELQLSLLFAISMQTTISKMNNYMVIFKIHGLDAIQFYNSDRFARTQSISSNLTPEQRLATWSSSSSLSNRTSLAASSASNTSSASSAASTVSTAPPSRASTICSDEETDEDYFSGTDASTTGSIRVRSKSTPRILYTFAPKQDNNIKNSDGDPKEMDQIVLEQPSREMSSCKFQPQPKQGQPFKAADMVILRSKPIEGTQVVTYEVSLGYGSLKNQIGKASITIDPRNVTQGIARANIYDCHENKTQNNDQSPPIGHLSLDYLVITNPIGFATASPQPSWLSKLAQLDAGHRGSGSGCRVDIPGSIVENTVDSFNYAARHGADMCELDVFVSADGVPVVYHDFDVDVGKAHKVQVNEYTLKELREFSRLSLHNDEGRHLELDVTKQAETNRPFPTLQEVLKNVDMSCALNIEIKWPQQLANGQLQGHRNREVNDFVDRILECIMKDHNGRSIILSTFDADIAIMLRLKQTQFPVLFLTTGDSQRFLDPRTKTVKNGIHFAQAFDLAGINPRSDHITQYLVRYAKDRNLLVYSWGNEINSTQAIRELKRIGLNGVIYDKIDLIKPKD